MSKRCSWLFFAIPMLFCLGAMPATAANIKVTKSVSSSAPAQGDTITYTVRIQNTSLTQNSGAFVVHDTLPAGITYVSSSSSVLTSSYDPSTHTWSIANPYNLQRFDSLMIIAVVNAGTEGRTIVNTAYKTSNSNDSQADDTSRVSLQVVSLPPVINSASPATGARYQSLNVKIGGAHLIQGATQISFGAGIAVNSTSTPSSDTMIANITITGAASLGARDIRVVTPPPGGGSDSLVSGFSVDNPIPVLSTISPANAYVQDPQFTLTVNGSHFVQGCVVTLNGNNRSTTFVDSTRLQATVLAGDLLVPGPAFVKVYTNAPGGGFSAKTETLFVKPAADISVSKALGRLNRDTVTYLLTARNLGPNDGTGISVTDNLPGTLIYISSNASGGTLFTNTTHLWDIGALAAGDSATCTIVTRLANPSASGITITNIARLQSANEFDRVAANNADSVSILLKILRPGDTNNDMLVDAADIVEIGLCYGITGPTRSGTPDSLQQYLSLGWNTVGSPEVCAYADCNGNGVVDSGDVWTIVSNWGRTHWTGGIAPEAPPVVSRESIIRQLIASTEAMAPGRARTEILAMLHAHLGGTASRPVAWSLDQNYPNPFNGETIISYGIEKHVTSLRVVIYDILGRIVRTYVRNEVEPGNYSLRWDGSTEGGSPVASGLYYYRLEAPDFSAVRKLLYIR